MSNVIKTEDHHWWPQSLSRYWLDEDGVVHQLFPDGRVVGQKSTKKFGQIKNAHLIKLHKDPATPTVWDESFEARFGPIDDQIPAIVAWLNDLPFKQLFDGDRRDRFLAAPQSQEKRDALLELIMSLVVRGPRLRNITQATTEHYRARMGMTEPAANKSLIALNIRDAMNRFMAMARGRGKFLVLRAGAGEFIFGDGFLHSFESTANAPMDGEIVVPITPEIAVMWILPMSYDPEPNLSTIVLQESEVAHINTSVLVHSRDFVFYRSIAPPLIPEFTRHAHLKYGWPRTDAIAKIAEALATLR